MLYGKINPDLSITRMVDRRGLERLFPTTSFPEIITDANLKPFGFACIKPSKAPDELKEAIDKRFAFNIVMENGVYKRKYYLMQLTEAEAIFRRDNKWKEIRSVRDKLLAESDYTQLPDYNHKKEEWAVYRQTLRDMPSSGIDPFQIEFPPKPI